MLTVKRALLWIILLSVISIGVISYLFMSNTLDTDPDYAILGLCLNVTIAFTATLTLFIRQRQCPSPGTTQGMTPVKAS